MNMNENAAPSWITGKQLTLLTKFGFDNLVNQGNLETYMQRAERLQRNAEAVHHRAHRRYYRNQMAKASRRANRGK